MEEKLVKILMKIFNLRNIDNLRLLCNKVVNIKNKIKINASLI